MRLDARDRVVRNARAAAVLMCVAGLLTVSSRANQGGLDRRELAEYRLTVPAFEKFLEASRRIAIVTAGDPAFQTAPLFSQDIAQGGDVTVAAGELEARLLGHAELVAALHAARLPAREYTKLALTVIAARLALGFLEAGLLKTVPPGAAAENVAFVRAHRTAADEILTLLRVEMK